MLDMLSVLRDAYYIESLHIGNGVPSVRCSTSLGEPTSSLVAKAIYIPSAGAAVPSSGPSRPAAKQDQRVIPGSC